MKDIVLTTDKLIEWLRTQPRDEEYIWQDPVFCLMGRYLHDQGTSWGEVGYSEMPYYHEIAHVKPWTFGAALQRAEALKALPPPSPALVEMRSDIERMEDELRGRPREGELQPLLEYAGGSDQAQDR